LPSSLDNYPLPPNYRFIPNESWEIEMDHGGDEEGWIYMVFIIFLLFYNIIINHSIKSIKKNNNNKNIK